MVGKKIVLFMVEGETDMVSLEGVFESIFNNDEVEFYVIHGDLNNLEDEQGDIIEGIKNCIQGYMRDYYLKKDDIKAIYHIIDTDGAFIPDDRVEKGSNNKIIYTENKIITATPSQILSRNHDKRAFVKKLINTDSILGIEYGIYYFSRNLEHVLHNCSMNLQKRDKCTRAYRFSEDYSGKPKKFLDFIRNETVAVNQSYEASWAFIFSRCNSLKRYSNVHLIFTGIEK